MAKIAVSGIPPFDGSYPFEGDFTMRELHTIKRLSGLRAGELQEALSVGDTDFVMALAVIVMQRAGKTVDENALWDAPAGCITLDLSDDEDEDGEGDAGPPELAAEPNENGGGSSAPGSETPVSDPSPTGDPPSDMSATFVPETSAS